MLQPGLIFLDRDGPANPLVAREGRYVFPRRQCFRVGRERLAEIGGEIVYNSCGDANGCHRDQPTGNNDMVPQGSRIGGASTWTGL